MRKLNLLIRLAPICFKKPVNCLLLIGYALVAGFAWHYYEAKIARPAMSIYGVPQEKSGWADRPLNEILRNDGFLLNYSQSLLNPLWVIYKVTQTHQRYGKRPPFEADWRTGWRVAPDDYRHSHYDRGHNAPNYVIASRYGRSAQLDTFLMSNISPQKARLNRKAWQRLEEISADIFSKKYPEFWVITGPIFNSHPKRLKHTNIAIPTAFYKIFFREDATGPKILALILPQNAKPKANLMQFVTSVDAIENQTGFDFFWQLPDDLENRIEKTKTPQDWEFKAVSNRPGRY